MKIRHLFLPKFGRLAAKKSKWSIAKLRVSFIRIGTRFGYPRYLAQALRRCDVDCQVVAHKKGITSIRVGDKLARFGHSRTPCERLVDEYNGWNLMKQSGFSDIIPHEMQLEKVNGSVLLWTQALRPVKRSDYLGELVQILKAFNSRSSIQHDVEMPITVRQGLKFAKGIVRGPLPQNFIAEDELAEVFRSPLSIGVSHSDLHWRNIMLHNEEPILVDLKKCASGRVLALDAINAACKWMTTRNGGSNLAQAFDAQRIGWKLPELRPVFEFIDIEAKHWGPIYCLHLLGQFRGVSCRDLPYGADILFRRLIEGNWQQTKG